MPSTVDRVEPATKQAGVGTIEPVYPQARQDMGLKQRMLLGRLLLLSQPDQPLALLILGIHL